MGVEKQLPWFLQPSNQSNPSTSPYRRVHSTQRAAGDEPDPYLFNCHELRNASNSSYNDAVVLHDSCIAAAVPACALITQHFQSLTTHLNMNLLPFALKIRFLNGDDAQHDFVMKTIEAWNEGTSLTFQKVDANPSHVRIMLTEDDSWCSQIGPSIYHNGEKTTMILGLSGNYADSNDKTVLVKCKILHEFGHVLGLYHEHSHPDRNIPFDRENAYLHYSHLGWDPADVDDNVLQQFDREEVYLFPYCRSSIMHYPIQVDILESDAEAYQQGWNLELCPCDRAFIKTMFPLLDQTDNTDEKSHE